MSNEALVQTVKQIVGLARDGQLDEAYRMYQDLFSGPDFMSYAPEHQRRALGLMIHAKNLPSRPTPAIVEAHRAAVVPLTELVSAWHEPVDHEMLGMCHVVLGNEDSAREIFRAGLALERERNPQSDLCGTLMKRISFL